MEKNKVAIMYKCVIENCTNNEGTDRFFKFPLHGKIFDKWEKFCGCEAINTQTARLCWAHFTEDAFDNLSDFEKGLTDKLVLKWNAVPTIMACSRVYDAEKECAINETNESETNEFSKSVLEGLKIYDSFIQKKSTEPKLAQKPRFNSNQLHDEQFEGLDLPTDGLLRKVEQKIAEVKSLEETIDKLRHDKFHLIMEGGKNKRQWEQELKDYNNISKSLSVFLTPTQIEKLTDLKEKRQYSEAEYDQFLHLFFVSAPAYRLLLSWNYPLPSRRSLERYMHKYKIKRDDYLKLKRLQEGKGPLKKKIKKTKKLTRKQLALMEAEAVSKFALEKQEPAESMETEVELGESGQQDTNHESIDGISESSDFDDIVELDTNDHSYHYVTK